jgi:hypothetical protein
MPKIIFHPDVSYEIKASYNWYQKKVAGLGEDFMNLQISRKHIDKN